MTKKEAVRNFKNFFGDIMKSDDLPLKRQTWCDYVDHLCKDGQITEKQGANWLNPF